jgi:hypothetical protein
MVSINNLGDLLVLVIMFGLDLIAILILILSAFYARRLDVVIVLGVVAAVLMFVESFLWLAATVIGSSGGALTSDNEGFRYLKILTGMSILSLLIYFPTAILRWKARSKRSIAAQDAT